MKSETENRQEQHIVLCSIQLPNSVVVAYGTGVLPLNMLSHAVLTKNNQSEDRE